MTADASSLVGVESIASRLDRLRATIAAAALGVGRDPESVTLVCVAKTQPAEALAAAIESGARCFGINYVAEGLEQMEALEGLVDSEVLSEIDWRLIGKLQSNKVGKVVSRFTAVDSIDRVKTARKLDDAARRAESTISAMIQVNVSREAQKGGVVPEEVVPLLDECAEFSHLEIAGLMAIPISGAREDERREEFADMRRLRDSCVEQGLLADDASLSIGMSNDFEVAISEGATHVRLGTALFGARA